MHWIYVLLFLALIGMIARSVWKAPARSRRLVAISSALVLVYLGCLIVLICLERFFIYHPQTASQAWLAPAPLRAEDVWLTSEQDIRLHAWWCPLEGAERVVLYSHGNAGNLSFRRDAILAWQRHVKASVLIYDYPGFGKSDGQPDESGCYSAGKAAYDWLRTEKQIDSQQITLYGKSLGGAVAVHLATTEPHEALVLYCPFTSIPDLGQRLFPMFPIRWMARTQFDNAAKITQFHGPLVIGHGLADALVPSEQGQRLFDLCPSANKKLLLYEGEGHAAPPTEFYVSVAEYLKSLPAQRMP